MLSKSNERCHSDAKREDSGGSSAMRGNHKMGDASGRYRNRYVGMKAALWFLLVILSAVSRSPDWQTKRILIATLKSPTAITHGPSVSLVLSVFGSPIATIEVAGVGGSSDGGHGTRRPLCSRPYGLPSILRSGPLRAYIS